MARVQRVRNERGEVVGYRSQPRHPLTGKKVSIAGATEAEVLGRLAELQRLRRDRLAGAPSEEVQEAFGRRVMRPKKLSERWREWSAVREDSSGFAPRRSSWVHRLAPHFADAVPVELKPARMARWQVALRERWSAKTVLDSYWLLVALVKLAIHDGELTDLPWGDWRPERSLPAERAEAASWEEWLLLVGAALGFSRERWGRGTYDDAFQALTVMGLTGIRQAEAAGLGWDCLELDRKDGTPAILTVRWQARKGWQRRSGDRPRDIPKGKRRRAQVMHATAAEVLRRHREELKRRGWFREDGPVFPTRGGHWRQSAYVIRTSTLRELVRRAGLQSVEKWTGHSLRHTFCTLEANANVDLKAVMQRAGHTDVRTTLGYVHAARRLPPSPLPPLELQDYLPAVPNLVESADDGLLPTAPDLTRATSEKVVARQEWQKRKRQRESDMSKASFADVARKWVSVGGDGRLPPEVVAARRRAYVRAYVAAQREHPQAEKVVWQRAGRRAQHATVGAWHRALSRARAEAEKDEVPY
jgi:integrase